MFDEHNYSSVNSRTISTKKYAKVMSSDNDNTYNAIDEEDYPPVHNDSYYELQYYPREKQLEVNGQNKRKDRQGVK